MKIEQIKQWVLDNFYPEIIIKLQELKDLQEEISNLNTIIHTEKLSKAELLTEIELLSLNKNGLSEIDFFLQNEYTEVPKFAYKDKRKYNNHLYAVYPNEMIMPNLFYVEKAKQEVGSVEGLNNKELALKVGGYVDKQVKWVDDKVTTGMADFYHLPSETLISKEADCESHAFVVASLFPEIFGVAYGNTRKDNKGTWHAFNVFQFNGLLWVLETNSTANWSGSGNTWIKECSKSTYRIDWIFTKHKTFKVDGSTQFGHIAR